MENGQYHGLAIPITESHLHNRVEGLCLQDILHIYGSHSCWYGVQYFEMLLTSYPKRFSGSFSSGFSSVNRLFCGRSCSLKAKVVAVEEVVVVVPAMLIG